MNIKTIFAILILFCSNILYTFAKDNTAIENSIGIQLAFIPAGSFMMGSPYDEKWHQQDEKPHKVSISKSFYMSNTEITQAQWEKVMGFNRSHTKGIDLPVEKLSWKDAVNFCSKLSELEGKVYRLPTEAEWEYACRAGSNTPLGGNGNLNDVAWYSKNSDDQTQPVAQKNANAWGLFDMLGNVSEWCVDVYQPEYSDSENTDPVGPEKGPLRVIRGGAYDTFPAGLRCAARTSAPASYQYTQTGFRIVLEP